MKLTAGTRNWIYFSVYFSGALVSTLEYTFPSKGGGGMSLHIDRLAAVNKEKDEFSLYRIKTSNLHSPFWDTIIYMETACHKEDLATSESLIQWYDIRLIWYFKTWCSFSRFSCWSWIYVACMYKVIAGTGWFNTIHVDVLDYTITEFQTAVQIEETIVHWCFNYYIRVWIRLWSLL